MIEKDEIWENNIYRSLKDLANHDNQRLSWLGNDNDNISSLTETLGMLYDTFDFGEYINYHRELYGEDTLFILYNKLDNMINDYKKIGYALEMELGGAQKILEDPRWKEITEIGKQITDFGN